MQIKVRLLGTYRRYLTEGHDSDAGYMHQVVPGTRVGELLAELPIPPQDPYTYLVNGRHATKDQLLRGGDVLAVFPAVGGG
jgi:sulfur carrier protein ThiS